MKFQQKKETEIAKNYHVQRGYVTLDDGKTFRKFGTNKVEANKLKNESMTVFKVNMKTDKLLQAFILRGGVDL